MESINHWGIISNAWAQGAIVFLITAVIAVYFAKRYAKQVEKNTRRKELERAGHAELDFKRGAEHGILADEIPRGDEAYEAESYAYRRGFSFGHQLRETHRVEILARIDC